MSKLTFEDIERIAAEVEEQEIEFLKRKLIQLGIEPSDISEYDMYEFGDWGDWD